MNVGDEACKVLRCAQDDIVGLVYFYAVTAAKEIIGHGRAGVIVAIEEGIVSEDTLGCATGVVGIITA